jgi:predicted cytidylate kinase
MDVITVGGPPGSGTSTVCEMLKEELKIEYIYAGQIFRDRAKELKMSLGEFSDLCERDPSFDRELDDRMIEMARKGDALIEGRMIGPLCKKNDIPSFRIYMDADAEIRADRVMERDGGTLGSVLEKMKDREESEAQRYMEYYSIDPRELDWYHLVIDTSHISPKEELKIILRAIDQR